MFAHLSAFSGALNLEMAMNVDGSCTALSSSNDTYRCCDACKNKHSVKKSSMLLGARSPGVKNPPVDHAPLLKGSPFTFNLRAFWSHLWQLETEKNL